MNEKPSPLSVEGLREFHKQAEVMLDRSFTEKKEERKGCSGSGRDSTCKGRKV